MKIFFLILFALTLAELPALAAEQNPDPKRSVEKLENRCGWIDNPTPANWWLTDRDGTWTIGAQ